VLPTVIQYFCSTVTYYDDPHWHIVCTCALAWSKTDPIKWHQNFESISPRKAFKRDIRTFIQICISQGDDVLIVGDFNEPLGSEMDGIIRIAAEFHLVSLMQVWHQQNLPSMHTRGKRCLDYGLGTGRVANALVSCGYESFNERFATDQHRA
jgi:hypothetical protein